MQAAVARFAVEVDGGDGDGVAGADRRAGVAPQRARQRQRVAQRQRPHAFGRALPRAPVDHERDRAEVHAGVALRRQRRLDALVEHAAVGRRRQPQAVGGGAQRRPVVRAEVAPGRRRHAHDDAEAARARAVGELRGEGAERPPARGVHERVVDVQPVRPGRRRRGDERLGVARREPGRGEDGVHRGGGRGVRGADAEVDGGLAGSGARGGQRAGLGGHAAGLLAAGGGRGAAHADNAGRGDDGRIGRLPGLDDQRQRAREGGARQHGDVGRHLPYLPLGGVAAVHDRDRPQPRPAVAAVGVEAEVLAGGGRPVEPHGELGGAGEAAVHADVVEVAAGLEALRERGQFAARAGADAPAAAVSAAAPAVEQRDRRQDQDGDDRAEHGHHADHAQQPAVAAAAVLAAGFAERVARLVAAVAELAVVAAAAGGGRLERLERLRPLADRGQGVAVPHGSTPASGSPESRAAARRAPRSAPRSRPARAPSAGSRTGARGPPPRR